MIEINTNKTIVVGDLHFDSSSSVIENELDYKNRIKLWQEQIFPYMEENNINTIIQVGDFTTHRTYLSTYVMNKLAEDLFDVCEEKGYKLITILGNHDLYYKTNRDIYTLKIFEKAYECFTVISKKSEIIKLNENKILMIPWMIDEEDQKDVQNNLMQEEIDLVIGHFEIQNFSISKTAKASHGLKENFFKKVPVISGHFHLEQEIKNIHYIGVPAQDNWSSYNERCGFYVLDNHTLEKEFIENTVSPKHIKVMIDSTNKTFEIIGLGYEYKDEIKAKTNYDIFTNQKLKIYIELDNAWNKKVIEKIIEKCYSYKIDVKEEEVIENISTDEEDLTISTEEYDIDKSIIKNLDTNYQKDIYSKISLLADIDMQDDDIRVD